jgi:hypothetical protein
MSAAHFACHSQASRQEASKWMYSAAGHWLVRKGTMNCDLLHRDIKGYYIANRKYEMNILHLTRRSRAIVGEKMLKANFQNVQNCF